jgi:signal transduction histidine kinase
LILKEGLEPNAKPYGDVTRPSACIMRVPLRVKSKSTGVLAIHSYTPGAYGANNLNFLQTLADYCSGAFERIWAEESVRNLHKQLLETSRLAGMAEVATSVLHNVGNVLNSVNVSASVIGGKVRNSRVVNLGKAVDLMHAHKDDLAAFLADDARGRELPGYLSSLAVHLMDEQTQILGEIASLSNYVEHIKDIVAMQQNYARVSGVTESLNVIDLVEDAIRMNRGALERHNVKLVRDYQGAVPVNVDKHKALQILVNLIRNAKYALDDGAPPEKILTIRVATDGDDRVKISVADNGVGIPAENLVRIFGHGFTTRKNGHGFGLHSGALAAKEMGGSLSVQSDGWGAGATFTLEFPRNPVG